jgi:hypothetical protein
MLLKREMDACLASRCFYLARALTLLHKSTPLLPSYPLPSIQRPLPPNWSLGLIRKSFSYPFAIMPSLHHSV